MNDKRQSWDNDDDNFLDPRQSHFRLLSNNQQPCIYTSYFILHTSYLTANCCKHFSTHFILHSFPLSIFSIFPGVCISAGVLCQESKMTQDMTEEKQKLAATNASYLPVSLFITPSPGYQMSGLGFLLICSGRSWANICFIFHSFWWSSSLQLRHTSSFILGNWR